MRSARLASSGAGFLLLLLGVWGALIPFIGPYAHYGFSPDAVWHFTTNRLWLDIAPGVAVAVGGFLLVAASDSARGMLGSWLALIGGGWFLIGSASSVFWSATIGPTSSAIGVPLGSSHRAAWELIGFFYGVGALTVALSAFAIGVIAGRPRYVREPSVVAIDESSAPTEPAVVHR